MIFYQSSLNKGDFRPGIYFSENLVFWFIQTSYQNSSSLPRFLPLVMVVCPLSYISLYGSITYRRQARYLFQVFIFYEPGSLLPYPQGLSNLPWQPIPWAHLGILFRWSFACFILCLAGSFISLDDPLTIWIALCLAASFGWSLT